MSFLNPVTLPVKRFSSTDANAPQINYSSRVAGDVKTVFKACLVTGYGSAASAGWTIQNETTAGAEFKSPAVSMSDYAFGIDDNSTANTTFYNLYQGTRFNPDNNLLKKSIPSIKSYAWQMLVTDRAIMFVEIFKSSSSYALDKMTSRVTFFGQIKSAFKTGIGQNMMFWQYGWGQTQSAQYTDFVVQNATYKYVVLNGTKYSGVNFNSIAQLANNATPADMALSSVELIGDVYVVTGAGVIIGRHPAVLTRTVNDSTKVMDVYDTTYNNRPMLYLNLGCATVYSADITIKNSTPLMIYLDSWEF